MGESQTFSFGNLVKILIPGLALSAAIYMFIIGGTTATVTPPALPADEQARVQFIALTIVPFSLFLGLIINAIVFVFLTRILVRFPHGLFAVLFYRRSQRLNEKIRAMFLSSVFDEMDDGNKRKIAPFLDTEILLLEQIGSESLSYVQEKYFLYHEVQMNMIAAAILFAGLFFFAEKFGWNESAFIHVDATIIYLVIIVFTLIMWWAAYANYDRYLKKSFSLRMAAFRKIKE